MAKLTRVTGKVFGGSAPLDEIGQFGSALAGNPTNTQDVATIQALDAYSEGWGSAVVTSRQFPPIEEVTGALKTISYQGCYLLQEGIPEYDANTEYSNTSIVKTVNDGVTTLYVSLANGNKGNALSNATYWKSYVLSSVQRNIGEIVTSTIPLEDSGLHLLDGSLLDGNGIYGNFVTYIAGLVSDYPDLFTTETNWQNTVTTYGVCGKFVYDSINNTVRLPKITGIIESTTDTNALGDLTQALCSITVPCTGWGTTGGGLGTAQYGRLITGSGEPEQREGLESIRAAGNDKTITTSTVQPQTVKVLYYIVVATSVKTSIEVDIDEIATDLNGKADVDLTNVNNTGKIAITHNAMPSDTYIDLTLGASGTSYTAPADGFAYIHKTCPTNVYWDIVLNSLDANNNVMVNKTIVRDINGSGGILLAVRKNQKFMVNWYSGSGGSVDVFRFYYAVGSESEAQ